MMHTFCSYNHSPLGLLQIKATKDAIVSVLFCDTETDVSCPNELTAECSKQLDEYFAGTRKDFNLAMDQGGTSFQQKVWKLLAEIPFGKNISYKSLSQQYGDPKAIRAIASANGRNKLSIIIPCHRVIGSNQSLTGYAGGLWRKQWLLEHEAKFSSGLQLLF